jgi:translation initiation factor IF-1
MTKGSGQPDSDSAGAASERTTAPQKAVVLKSLINGLFRLQMADGRPVVAHVAKDLRMALSRLLPGDQVLVDVSPYDPGKARICKLLAQ